MKTILVFQVITGNVLEIDINPSLIIFKYVYSIIMDKLNLITGRQNTLQSGTLTFY